MSGGLIDPASFAPLLLFTLVAYVYVAACLMVIATKTGAPRPWLAWIPFANLYLMCVVAQKPAWWVVLMLIPFVNLVVFAIVWSGIAQARGKPGWLGFLMLIPIVNLAIPAYLAIGPATAGIQHETDTVPSASSEHRAQRLSVVPTARERFMGPRVCPSCGAAVEADDTFCSSCGASVPAVAGAVAAEGLACPSCGAAVTADDVFCEACGAGLSGRRPSVAPSRAFATATATAPRSIEAHSPEAFAAPKRNPLPMIAAIAAAVLALAALWIFFGAGSYTVPQRSRPAMPASMSRTLFELPVDSDPSAPAVLTEFGVVTIQRTSMNPLAGTVLAPGVEIGALVPNARAVSAAAYRSGAQAATVHVAVIDVPPRTNAAQTTAERVQQSIQGDVATIHAQNPSGATYPGYTIRTGQVTVHVLTNPSGNGVILVWAPEPSAFPLAGRLAANVGSGARLVGAPRVRSTFGALPTAPPFGIELAEVLNLGSDDLNADLSRLAQTPGAASDPDYQSALTHLRKQNPRSFTVARYLDRGGNDWNAAIAYFGDSNAGRLTWWKTRLASGKTMRLVNVSGVEALYKAHEQGQLMVFRKGPFLAIVDTPRGTTPPQLRQFMEALQL